MKTSEHQSTLRRHWLVATSAAIVVALSSIGCSESFSPTSPTLTSGASPAAGATRTAATGATALLRFSGSLEGSFTFTADPPPSPFASVRLEATGVGSHVGRFTLTTPHRVDLSSLPARGVGTFELVAANGDSLTGRLEGLGTLTAPPDGFTIVETYTITAGTGRFAGATGSFIAERAVNLTTLETTGSFEGTITSVGRADR